MKVLIGGILGGVFGVLVYQLMMHSDQPVDIYRALFVGGFVGVSCFIASKFEKNKS